MLRFCLIGCGAHSETAHAEPLRIYGERFPDRVTLSAACDVRPERAEAFCRRFGFTRAYTDWETMLAAETPDAVLCIVPIPLIVPIGGELLRRGIPCILEKPPGATLDEVAALTRVAQETGTPHQVSVNRRFSPFLNRALAFANDTGTPLRYVHARMLRHARTEPEFIWGTGVHIVDAMRHIGGEWDSFTVRTIAPPETSAPWFIVSLRFASGCLGTVEVLPTVGAVEERYDLYGDGYFASAVTMGTEGESVRVWRNRTLELEERGDPSAPLCLRDGSFDELCAFIDSLRDGLPLHPPLAKIAPSMDLCARIGAALNEAKG